MAGIRDVLDIPLKLILGGMVILMCAMLFGSFVTGFSLWEGSMALNCPGYIDTVGNASAVGNNSYDPSKPTIPYICPIIEMAPGFVALAIILGIIVYMVLPGRVDEQAQQY
jgi:hypothetical protein